LLACELGDTAPAADAVSDDVIVQLLVFLGRPEPLAELGLHAAAAAGEPSHSPLPRSLSLLRRRRRQIKRRGKGNVGDRPLPLAMAIGGCLWLALCLYVWAGGIYGEACVPRTSCPQPCTQTQTHSTLSGVR